MLRHSSLAVIFCALVVAGAITACNQSKNPAAALSLSKINRANYDQIHEKASKDEVRAILGPPTSEKMEDKVIYKRSIWRYVEGDKYINLTFKNDELDSKDTNLGT
jgi:outer membrane protein assembly factor BamE (lipoprotein component of BamABCDE complex)